MKQKQKQQIPDNGTLLYSIEDSAQLLGVSSSSIRRLIHRGILQPVRLWRHLRIPATQLRKLAQSE